MRTVQSNVDRRDDQAGERTLVLRATGMDKMTRFPYTKCSPHLCVGYTLFQNVLADFLCCLRLPNRISISMADLVANRSSVPSKQVEWSKQHPA